MEEIWTFFLFLPLLTHIIYHIFTFSSCVSEESFQVPISANEITEVFKGMTLMFPWCFLDEDNDDDDNSIDNNNNNIKSHNELY